MPEWLKNISPELAFAFLLFAVFIIGVVLGGLLLFLSRRIMLAREIGIAERKAAQIISKDQTRG